MSVQSVTPNDQSPKVNLLDFDRKGLRKYFADELGEKGFKDGGDVSLTVIKIPDISESGVESLFKRR